jgi:allantoicase
VAVADPAGLVDEGLCAEVAGVDLLAVHFEGSSAKAVVVPAVHLYEGFSIPIHGPP